MNVPFLCIFVTFGLIYAPRIVVMRGQAQTGRYDNRNPRDQQATLEGAAKRASAAHANSFEDFAPFAASVILAHLARVPEGLVSALAMAHVGLRAAYLYCYIADKPTLRTSVWVLGFLTTLALFVMAVIPR